ncbi:MAG: hypothetical protein QHD01_34850 [Bradyrhizobium sp.]|uniref:hypothetical protein n=1 Tax=Bradyrhizobium sp. TaxID=376 RepID=UPI0029B30D82|nr:hypothetical protein [Bradyrhizobium sp.]MDX3971752.1 hypothetical protein [Bradyrhizobium sp.]
MLLAIFYVTAMSSGTNVSSEATRARRADANELFLDGKAGGRTFVIDTGAAAIC